MSNGYRDVKSLVRGLRILEALGQKGAMKVSALAETTDIDRSSIYRLVNTLESMGYLLRRSEDGAISLTSKMANISDGFRDDDLIAQTITPFIHDLTHTVLWPSDFATFSEGAVTVQVTTHKLSPMSIHRAVVGRHHSLFRSALGRAMLSVMTQKEIDTASVVAQLETPNSQYIWDRKAIRKLIADVRKAGYASSVGESETNISAIALPLRVRSVVGAVNVVFFRSAMTPQAAADRYLEPLKACVRKVKKALST